MAKKVGPGVIGGPNAALASFSPVTDFSIGGNLIIFSGEGFDPREYDDTFENLILNPARWLPALVGSATYGTGWGAHLSLSTGTTAGSSVDIESVADFSPVQGEIRAKVPPIESSPGGEVILVSLVVRVDAANYASIGVYQDSTGYHLFARVYSAGVLVDELVSSVSYGTYDLKILRYSNDLVFVSNGVVYFVSTRFPAGNVKFAVRCSNLAQVFDATSVVEWFYFRSFIKFGEYYIHAPTVVSDTRMRYFVPPSMVQGVANGRYAGDVDVTVVGKGGEDTIVDGFSYTYKKELRLMDSLNQLTKMDIINYNNVKTPKLKNKGL